MVWAKGESGNPSGRRPMHTPERLYLQSLRAVLAEEITIHDEIGKEIIAARKDRKGRPTKEERKQLKEHSRTVNKIRRMAEIVFEEALKGEVWAIEHVAERLDGKPRRIE